MGVCDLPSKLPDAPINRHHFPRFRRVFAVQAHPEFTTDVGLGVLNGVAKNVGKISELTMGKFTEKETAEGIKLPVPDANVSSNLQTKSEEGEVRPDAHSMS